MIFTLVILLKQSTDLNAYLIRPVESIYLTIDCLYCIQENNHTCVENYVRYRHAYIC